MVLNEDEQNKYFLICQLLIFDFCFVCTFFVLLYCYCYFLQQTKNIHNKNIITLILKLYTVGERFMVFCMPCQVVFVVGSSDDVDVDVHDDDK